MGWYWGHLEYEELNHPKLASYREIEEETGFKEGEIKNFRLKYILIESGSGEIRQQFVYFGDTKHTNFISSDEGELFWIHKNDLLSLHMSKIIKFTIEHYLHNPNSEHIYVGIITTSKEQIPRIQWSRLEETSTF